MIKKVIKITAYVLVSVFLFTTVNLLMLPKYVNENLDGRITAEFYREKLSNDILFLGASTVFAGISPTVLWEKYGLTSYDRSNASQTIKISYYMAKDALRVNKPKLVVLDVGFLLQAEDFYEEPSLRKAYDEMKLSSVKLEAIKACEPEYDNKKLIEYLLPVFRYHARWNDLSSEDVRYLYHKPNVTYNGQLVEFGSKKFAPEEFADVSKNYPQFINDENIKYLQMLADLCKENDIDLLLIKLPRIYQIFTDYANGQLMDFAEKNNIIYMDFQDVAVTINDDVAGFRDTQHLNAYGAEMFTGMLGEFIISNYDIIDHSKDDKFIEVWTKKSQNFRDAMSRNPEK